MQKIVFIGAGSIAEALIHGWVENKVITSESIYISNRSNQQRLQELASKYGVQQLEGYEQLLDADLIILAMKPKDARLAMDAIRPYIEPDVAVLSVLAGISIATIEDHLGARPIARVMPNTSATIGMSMLWNCL